MFGPGLGKGIRVPRQGLRALADSLDQTAALGDRQDRRRGSLLCVLLGSVARDKESVPAVPDHLRIAADGASDQDAAGAQSINDRQRAGLLPGLHVQRELGLQQLLGQGGLPDKTSILDAYLVTAFPLRLTPKPWPAQDYEVETGVRLPQAPHGTSRRVQPFGGVREVNQAEGIPGGA